MVRRLLPIAIAALLALPAVASAYTPREHPLYQDGPSGRYLLDHGWSSSASQSGRFRPVSIPNAFNARDHTTKGNRSRVQWYRERFTLPRTSGAAGWRLRFESVNVRADVWLNGRKIGSHVGAYLPFELPATGIRRGSNELLVRVDGRKERGDIPPAGRSQGWWNYGGILREVYLRKVYRVNLGDPQVTTTIGDPARVAVKAQVRGSGGDARLDVSGPNGFGRTVTVPVAELPTTGASLEVPSPQLWSPSSPALYTMKITAPRGQVTTIHFGFRQWGKAPDGTPLLNGQPLRLRGASFHEDLLQPSTVADELHALGANFTRQHYPPSPELLEAFDRMGIVMWEQIPVWRLRGSDLTRLNRVILGRLRQTILRDRNHASVMAWSVENEVVRPGSQESAFLTRARGATKRLDPTRYFAVDQTVTPGGKLPAYYDKLDALGISEYVGWYGNDPISDVRPALDATRAQLPGVALFVTEFGAEANRPGPASVKGTYAFQAQWLDQQLSAMDATPYLGGAIVWLLRDYAVRPGWSGGNPRPSPPFSKKGLLNLQGKPKPAWSVAKTHFGLRSSSG